MHERLRWLERPGPWLWLCVALGVGVRAWLVVATEGTFDVAIKQHHGTQVARLGLLGWYRVAEVFNHPPLMGEVFAGMVRLSELTGLPFRSVLRLPFALLDAGTALLLLRLLRGRPERFAVAAGYWLHPLAILFSSYHGNTDSAVAAAALAAVVLASAGRPAAAGAALGVGVWIKLPVVLAAPAIFFALEDARARVRLAAAAVGVGCLTYLPALIAEPGLLVQRIAGYPGSGLETPGGLAIWGLVHTLRLADTGLAGALAQANTWVCWVPVLVFAWLRRGRSAPLELGASVGGSFLILYGFTSFWAWQYLAWGVPFFFCLGPRFGASSAVLLGGYVYGAYAYLTGSPALLGVWDFRTPTAWPPPISALRDASVLFCFGSACWLLARAVLDERLRRKAAAS